MQKEEFWSEPRSLDPAAGSPLWCPWFRQTLTGTSKEPSSPPGAAVEGRGPRAQKPSDAGTGRGREMLHRLEAPGAQPSPSAERAFGFS